jgi:hypothetical protein
MRGKTGTASHFRLRAVRVTGTLRRGSGGCPRFPSDAAADPVLTRPRRKGYELPA